MNLNELGARIRGRREKQGLKQADLAAAVRVSPQAVSKWERGENAPDISVLAPLARLLDVSVEWLLTGGPAERETFEAVVFATALDGFASRAEATAPAALTAWLNGLHLTVTEAVRAFDGVPVKYVGDGFLGFFAGAERFERATQASLRAADLAQHAGLRVALAAGPVFLGTLGHPDYAAPDIIGEAVNTAFMLLPHVTSGGVIATEAVASGVEPRFALRGEVALGEAGTRTSVFAPA